MDQYNGMPQRVINALPTAKNIAATTNASPIVLTTSAAHNVQTGDFVYVVGAEDPGANGVWEAGTVTGNTVVLVGTTGTLVGGAQGTMLNLGFEETYGMPTDLVDDMDAASVNVALEALGDRTAYNLLQAWYLRRRVEVIEPTIVRAWAKITCNGSGAVALDDQEGIASVEVNSTRVLVTFSAPFANTNYAPSPASLDGTTRRYYSVNASTMTTTTLEVHVIDPLNDVTIDPSANICRFSLLVAGRLP